MQNYWEFLLLLKQEFLAAGTGVQGRHSYTILGLWPSTDYEIRITALNAAGLTNALYSLSTLPLQAESGESSKNCYVLYEYDLI